MTQLFTIPSRSVDIPSGQDALLFRIALKQPFSANLKFRHVSKAGFFQFEKRINLSDDFLGHKFDTTLFSWLMTSSNGLALKMTLTLATPVAFVGSPGVHVLQPAFKPIRIFFESTMSNNSTVHLDSSPHYFTAR